MLQHQQGDLLVTIPDSKAKREQDTRRVGYLHSRFGREMAETLWK